MANAPSRIAVCTDLSDHGNFAARWAHQMAELCQWHIWTAHVIEFSIPNWFSGKYEVAEDAQAHRRAEDRVRRWYHSHTGSEPDGVFVDVGDPYEHISRFAESQELDLLVLSKSEKSTMERFLVGSTAKALAAHPPCPIALVDPEHTSLQGQQPIVVATDLTKDSVNALDRAARLAEQLGTALHILHVASPLPANEDLTPPKDLDPAQAQQRLETWVNQHQALLGQLQVKALLLRGDLTQSLHNYVDAHKIDIIYIGFVHDASLVKNVFRRNSVRLPQYLSATLIVVP